MGFRAQVLQSSSALCPCRPGTFCTFESWNKNKGNDYTDLGLKENDMKLAVKQSRLDMGYFWRILLSGRIMNSSGLFTFWLSWPRKGEHCIQNNQGLQKHEFPVTKLKLWQKWVIIQEWTILQSLHSRDKAQWSAHFQTTLKSCYHLKTFSHAFHVIQWLTFQQALWTYPTAAYLSFGAPNYGSGPNGWQVLWVDCATLPGYCTRSSPCLFHQGFPRCKNVWV